MTASDNGLLHKYISYYKNRTLIIWQRVKKAIETVYYTDLAANKTVVLMVILPQSYGWGRVQGTESTASRYPAVDGSVPLTDEHLHEKDTGPGSVVKYSEQHQCHLNEHRSNVI